MSVLIYSTPSCSYCNLAKQYLSQKGIPYTDYNVAAQPDKADEMLRKSGQMGVPVLDVNGRVIVGFNQGEIEKALHR